MIHSHTVNGLPLQTGDLICTVDSDASQGKGKFWGLLGRLLPGKVGHIVIYTGPAGRCVEAGATGKVIAFETGDRWNAEAMFGLRNFVDVLFGASFPLAGRGLMVEAEKVVRRDVAAYCLEQVGKPYNVDFLDPSTDKAFYCSQLAWKAYQRHGIDIRKKRDDLPLDEIIVYPQQIWDGCQHKRAMGGVL